MATVCLPGASSSPARVRFSRRLAAAPAPPSQARIRCAGAYCRIDSLFSRLLPCASCGRFVLDLSIMTTIRSWRERCEDQSACDWVDKVGCCVSYSCLWNQLTALNRSDKSICCSICLHRLSFCYVILLMKGASH